MSSPIFAPPPSPLTPLGSHQTIIDKLQVDGIPIDLKLDPKKTPESIAEAQILQLETNPNQCVPVFLIHKTGKEIAIYDRPQIVAGTITEIQIFNANTLFPTLLWKLVRTGKILDNDDKPVSVKFMLGQIPNLDLCLYDFNVYDAILTNWWRHQQIHESSKTSVQFQTKLVFPDDFNVNIDNVTQAIQEIKNFRDVQNLEYELESLGQSELSLRQMKQVHGVRWANEATFHLQIFLKTKYQDLFWNVRDVLNYWDRLYAFDKILLAMHISSHLESICKAELKITKLRVQEVQDLYKSVWLHNNNGHIQRLKFVNVGQDLCQYWVSTKMNFAKVPTRMHSLSVEPWVTYNMGDTFRTEQVEQMLVEGNCIAVTAENLKSVDAGLPLDQYWWAREDPRSELVGELLPSPFL